MNKKKLKKKKNTDIKAEVKRELLKMLKTIKLTKFCLKEKECETKTNNYSRFFNRSIITQKYIFTNLILTKQNNEL